MVLYFCYFYIGRTVIMIFFFFFLTRIILENVSNIVTTLCPDRIPGQTQKQSIENGEGR